jgi:hypothetical protein
MLSLAVRNHKWRSSLQPDDKCHLQPDITVTTAEEGKKLRALKYEAVYAALPSSADGPYKAGTDASFNRK